MTQIDLFIRFGTSITIGFIIVLQIEFTQGSKQNLLLQASELLLY